MNLVHNRYTGGLTDARTRLVIYLDKCWNTCPQRGQILHQKSTEPSQREGAQSWLKTSNAIKKRTNSLRIAQWKWLHHRKQNRPFALKQSFCASDKEALSIRNEFCSPGSNKVGYWVEKLPPSWKGVLDTEAGQCTHSQCEMKMYSWMRFFHAHCIQTPLNRLDTSFEAEWVTVQSYGSQCPFLQQHQNWYHWILWMTGFHWRSPWGKGANR